MWRGLNIFYFHVSDLYVGYKRSNEKKAVPMAKFPQTTLGFSRASSISNMLKSSIPAQLQQSPSHLHFHQVLECGFQPVLSEGVDDRLECFQAGFARAIGDGVDALGTDANLLEP
jgi:hypothetical protein